MVTKSKILMQVSQTPQPKNLNSPSVQPSFNSDLA